MGVYYISVIVDFSMWKKKIKKNKKNKKIKKEENKKIHLHIPLYHFS